MAPKKPPVSKKNASKPVAVTSTVKESQVSIQKSEVVEEEEQEEVNIVPAQEKRDTFDDFDFGDFDDAMQAYEDDQDQEIRSSKKTDWRKIMAEAQADAAQLAEEDLDEEEDEEEEEESMEESEEEEEEEDIKAEMPQFIFDPNDDDMPPEDVGDRKFYLEKDSFLNLLDPGLADALLPKIIPPEKVYKGTKAIKQEYKDICDELGIKPNKKFLDNLKSPVLDMTDYGLTDKDIIAMCYTLRNNTYIKKLSLRGSACGLQGGLAIAEMIENNYTITDLDISSTEILPAFQEICLAIQMNTVLEVLNVAMNELGDKEMVWVADFLKESSSMRELNLSRNYIGDLGAFNLSSGIEVNTSLEKLDLCWNRLRGTKKGFPLYETISKHPLISYFDIWGNAIADAGVRGITRVLSGNQQLTFMNISYNLLGDASCPQLGKSMARAPALKDFIVGPNEWREKMAIKLLAPLGNKNNPVPLEKLDFSAGLLVYKHFLKTERKVLRARPDLTIIHGESYGLRRRPRPDPRQLVIRRAKIVCENFATPLDMLIDELRTEPMKMDEQQFKKFIKSCNLYKDKVMTESLFRNFEIKNTREVDCDAIIDAYDKEYPSSKSGTRNRVEEEEKEVKPPKPKKDKKKGKKKDKKKGNKGKAKKAKRK